MNESRSERSIRTWSIYTTRVDDSSSSSMNAIAFGFVATAILISMFLIMAIFELLFRSDHHHSFTQDESAQFHKLAEQASLVPDVSVVMPGEKLPSHVALPAPFPCRREGIRWPPHTVSLN